MAKDEARVVLEQAMRALPATYCQVVSMYDLQGRPVGQVAAALGRSTAAVFMLRARAHDRLAEIMGSASKYWSDSA